jgi:hypothetical protein
MVHTELVQNLESLLVASVFARRVEYFAMRVNAKKSGLAFLFHNVQQQNCLARNGDIQLRKFLKKCHPVG